MRHLQLNHHRLYILAALMRILVLLQVKVGESQQVPSLWVFVILRNYGVQYFNGIFENLKFHE